MRTSLLTAALLATAAFAASGCGSDDSGTATGEGDGGGGGKAAKVDAAKGVVFVEGIYPDKRTQVTGVVFEKERGLVLTANHAIEGAQAIDVTLPDGTVSHGETAARAQCHDIAVLRLRPKPTELTAVPLADSSTAAIGQPVKTLAYQFYEGTGRRPPPLSQVPGRIFGIDVSATFAPLSATGPFIAHQTSLLPGASGSPLLDAQGRLIGFNTFIGHPRTPPDPGIEYALSSSYVKTRLRQLKPGKGGALGGWEAEHNSCHAALLKLLGKGHLGQHK
jgi:S1-C subfamily serine protease